MTYFRGKQTTMSLFTPKRPKLETQEISNIDKQQRNGYLMQCWWKRQSGCYSGEQFVTLTTTVKQMQPAAPRVHTSARRVTHTRPATKKYPADVQDSEEGLSLHHEQLFYDRCEWKASWTKVKYIVWVEENLMLTKHFFPCRHVCLEMYTQPERIVKMVLHSGVEIKGGFILMCEAPPRRQECIYCNICVIKNGLKCLALKKGG